MTAPARESILIDCDPGQDDAVALLLALASGDRVNLVGVTVVAGNVPVHQGTANALRVLDLVNSDTVPVHSGADRPLLHPLETAEFVCGPDGLAGAGLPAPSRRPGSAHAVTFLIDTLRAAPERGVTLCALGPLTNLALALRLAPDIAKKLKRVSVMGGAMNLGNMTPAAEFNAYVDPHAAAIVLGSGLPVTLFGLHLTHEAVPCAADIEAFAALGTRTGRAVHGWLTRTRPGGLGTVAHPLHDPCVIAHLLWPDLFEGRDCHVEVETGEGPLRGRTTIDWNGRLRLPANAHVVARLDRARFFERLIGTLAHLP